MKKILVIQFQQVGDVLLSTELCVAIKNKYKEYQVDYLVASFTLGVVEGHPAINEIISLDKSKGFIHYFSVLNYVRKKKYDVIIDALCKPRTGLIALLSGASETVSFNRKGRGFFYKKLVPLRNDQKLHTIDMRMDLLRAIGLEVKTSQGATIYLSDEEKGKYKPVFESLGIKSDDLKIIFGVNSRRVFKEWPKENFLKVIEYVVEKYNAKIIFFHNEKEYSECLRLKNESQVSDSIYMDLPVSSLRDLVSLFYQCDFMIGNDSGPRHIAQALDIPTLSIFSPSSSKWGWNPHSNKRFVAVDIQDALSLTDEEFELKMKDATFENAHEYLKLISPEYIIQKTDQMIQDLELLNGKNVIR